MVETVTVRNLPDEFAVYRGFQGRREKGIAWTTDREKAVWFANRFAVLDRFGEPKLLTGVARKEDVLGYFTGRGGKRGRDRPGQGEEAERDYLGKEVTRHA